MKFLIRHWHTWWAAWHDDRLASASFEHDWAAWDRAMDRRNYHEDQLLRGQGK